MSRGPSELTSVFEIEGTLVESSTNPGSEAGRRATNRVMQLEAAEHTTGRHGQGARSIAELDLMALADPNATVRQKAFEAMGEMLRQQQMDDTDDETPEASAKPAEESKFRITGDMPFEFPAPRGKAELRDAADEVGEPAVKHPRFTGHTLKEFVEFTVDHDKNKKVRDTALEVLAELNSARPEALTRAVGLALQDNAGD